MPREVRWAGADVPLAPGSVAIVIGRNAVDREEDFDGAAAAERGRDIEVDLIEPEEPGLRAGVEHRRGKTSDGGRSLAAAAEAGSEEGERGGEADRDG